MVARLETDDGQANHHEFIVISAESGSNGFDLDEGLDIINQQESEFSITESFREYFERFKKNPSIAQTSHARINRMFVGAGIDRPNNQPATVHFFDGIFGLNGVKEQLANHFDASAKGLPVKNRIIVLMGPPGGAKSSIGIMLKRGLEQYSKTDDGSVHAIKGCPMYEEPLHLIPQELRSQIEAQYGIRVQGELCPHCQQMIREKRDENKEFKIQDVEVERISISEAKRRGIGSLTPTSGGSVDSTVIPEDWRRILSAEPFKANRGMLEISDLGKCDAKILKGLMTLAQESQFKAEGSPLVDVDEVIFTTTNEEDFLEFLEKNEGFKDRLVIIRVPFNLRLSDEMQIYEAELAKNERALETHIAPQTIEYAAMFAILTRLLPSKKLGVSIVMKMQAYNGEALEGFPPTITEDLQHEFDNTDKHGLEGMTGISPRYINNCIARAIAMSEKGCINPIDILNAIRDTVLEDSKLDKMTREGYLDIVNICRNAFNDAIKKRIQRSFVPNYETDTQTLFDLYYDNAEAYLRKTKLRDPITQEELEPDERVMRSLEEQLGISENAKKAFREEVLMLNSAAVRRHGKVEAFKFKNAPPRLKDAIEKKLFGGVLEIVQILTTVKTPDEEQLGKINGAISQLTQKENGYCKCCANDMLKYAGPLFPLPKKA